MSFAITARGFLGDAERDFALTAAMLPELERVTGSSILAIYQRIAAQDYRLSDLVEPIRLGLIGAGEAPAEAARLVRLYVEDRPFAEVYGLALGVLEARLLGRAAAEPKPVETTAPVEPAADAPSHPGIGSE